MFGFVHFVDFGQPNYLPVTTTIPQFNFTRSDTGFEYVNVFYHLNNYRNYVHGLGFTLADDLIEVDPVGTTADNSSFSFPTPKLIFGIGICEIKKNEDQIKNVLDLN